MYQQQVRCLTGFAAFVRSDRYGQGKQVAIGTVSGAILDAGTTVALSYEGNPKKAQDEKNISTKISTNDGRMEKGGSTH